MGVSADLEAYGAVLYLIMLVVVVVVLFISVGLRGWESFMIKRNRIKPYVLKINPAWPCYLCGREGFWRLNITGIDGDGTDLCTPHVREILCQRGNEQLLEDACKRGLR